MDEIQSLARGLQILDKVIESGRSVGITEIAAELGIDKSSASRLVRTLVNYRYLLPEPGTRRYVSGTRLLHIGWQMMNRSAICEKARPLLQWLVETTGECAHTAVYAEGKALVIDDVEAQNTLRVSGRTGRMIPLHCTAVGKGLIAFGDFPLPDVLSSHTARTITDLSQLRDHLAACRDQGFALDDEEYDEGIRCVAAPVYNAMGQVMAAIGVSGPAVRMTDERIHHHAECVKQAARELSVRLG